MLENELRQHLLEHLSWPELEGNDRTRFLTLALCGETGELANLLKKDWRGDVISDYREKLVSELADIGNYLYMLAIHLEVDLQKEMLNKLLEVEKRPAWKARQAE